MTQLYTSMAHTKRALDTGTPVPYTAFAPEWQARFDPSHVLGLGALYEDERGLKCPFRDCAHWGHSLGRHIQAAHDVELPAVKMALGLPTTMSLLSESARTNMRAAQKRLMQEGRSGIVRAQEQRRSIAATETRAVRRKKYRGVTVGLSVAARNWRGTCRAQLEERLKDAAERHGMPAMTQRQAIDILGAGTFKQIVRTFGSWNAAKSAVGLDARFRYSRRLTLAEAAEGLANFHKLYDRWPTAGEAQGGHYAPVIPSYTPVLRVTRARTWAGALRVVQRALRRKRAHEERTHRTRHVEVAA